ncbi:hypothetical protein BGO17_04275 [Candidatus Saccharibacteria bacterium 49-20]|nr:MAG: hypothetical protein BGO17_04275 [Candidatus Saccharibacteria bacterium 49-20]
MTNTAKNNPNTNKKDAASQLGKYQARVTVITPTYNRAELIKETIESVLAQDYEDFVYVILDDGSKDNTREVVEKLFEGRKNCFYLYHDNMGEADTVNKGWNLCNTEYFVQVNSDDTVEPTLLSDMIAALDANPDCVVAYPDFRIMNEQGETLEIVNNMDWSFPQALADFACYAAAPGAFFRKSKLNDIKVFKDGRFRHTNDIKMLWNMALKGNFIHVPKNLASWRSHGVGISANRYEAIEEIEVWIEEYFNQDLPKNVRDIEETCRKTIFNYYAQLMELSNLDYRADMANYYRERAELPMPCYVNLQVGDNDLIGNKFNGHDLHKNLRKRNIESTHLVWNKESDDKDTYVIAADQINRQTIRKYSEAIQRTYNLDNVHNPLMYEIMYNKLFLDADVVHLHLMHNGLWDLNLLPLMSKLKPTVWTVHDMWIATGDPRAESRPDYFFPFFYAKNQSLNWELKKEAIKNSDVTFVVASKYMERALMEHDVLKSKRIVHIPFGLNFETFYARDNKATRDELGLDASETLILLRGDGDVRKGLHYIDNVMRALGDKYKIHFLVVGNDEITIPEGVKATRYGWIKDDEMMAKLYSVADLFLMPSTREYFGMMAIEAMACGTLPIVLDGTSLAETVNSPTHGVSVAQDVQEYTKVVEHYIKNKSERKSRAVAGIEYVRKKHDMEKYLTALDELYQEVMTEHPVSKRYENITNEIRKFNEVKPRLDVVVGMIDPVKSREIDKMLESNAIDYKTLTNSIQALSDELQDIHNSKKWKAVNFVTNALPRRRHLAKLRRVGRPLKRYMNKVKDTIYEKNS